MDKNTSCTFDFFDPEFQQDTHPTYARLLEQCPFSKGKGEHDFYAVSRYKDIVSICKATDMWSSKFGPGLRYYSPDEPRALVNVDPPEHDVEVQIVRRAFSGAYIKSLEDGIRDYSRELLADLPDSGEIDIHRAYSIPIPLYVICKLLGIDYADAKAHGFDDWVINNAISTVYDPADEEKAAIAADAQSEMIAYFTPKLKEWSDRIAAGDAAPDENLITRLVTAEHEGVKLSTNKILGFCGFLLVAGSATTTTAITNLVYRLFRHPEQRAKLVAEPALIAQAVEEGLRYDAPVHGLFRTNNRPTKLGSYDLEENTKVALLWASGNLDPEFIDEPELFDISRELKSTRRNLTFGYGIHTCLGASLARMEIAIAIAELLAKMPNYELVGEPKPSTPDVMSGFESLMIKW